MILDLILQDRKNGHYQTACINHKTNCIEVKNYKIEKLYEIDDTPEYRKILLNAGFTIYHKSVV